MVRVALCVCVLCFCVHWQGHVTEVQIYQIYRMAYKIELQHTSILDYSLGTFMHTCISEIGSSSLLSMGR